MGELLRTVEVLERQRGEGLHVGWQLYVSRGGQVVADLARGDSRPGVGMTTDTLMLWMSASKPVTAVAIGQLWEQGKLSIDEPVARYIPEFAEGGKREITIRHCLEHTAGFRGPMNNFTGGTWEEIVARVCRMRAEPGWRPGLKAGYHAATSWFVLGEVVRRAGGAADYSEAVRERVFGAAGMKDCYIGMSGETFEALGTRLALMPQMAGGVAKYDVPANEAASTIVPRPGANGRGAMNQLGKLYEALLSGGTPLLRAQTVEAMTAPGRVGMMDASFQHRIDWGLGFYVNSNHYGDATTPYGYGPHASRRTYGHSGNQSSVAFADPLHKLVVALAFNGQPGEEAHQRRVWEVLTALYEELGLIGT